MDKNLNKKSKFSDDSLLSAKLQTNKRESYVSLIYTSHTKHIVPDLFVVCIQRLNYGGQSFKKQSAVYDSDAPVTLKQGQGHQTWYKLETPSKVTIMQSLKNLSWMVSIKKPTIKFL